MSRRRAAWRIGLVVPIVAPVVAPVVVLVVVLGLLGSISRASAGGTTPTAPGPALRIERQAAGGRPALVAILDGWPAGGVIVSVCGNEARRATQDCDATGAVQVTVPGAGSAVVRMPQLTPPIGCPCVVRASTVASTVSRTTPIDIPGVEVLPPDRRPADPTRPSPASQLQVEASVEDPSSWSESLLASFGGPARRVLVVRLLNRGNATLAPLQVRAAVGADAFRGDPLAVPGQDDVAAHGEQWDAVPFELPVATFGSFVVAGRVDGLDEPVRFRADTTQRPWGAVGTAGVLVVAVAARVRRRRSARRTATLATLPAAGPDATRLDLDELVGLRGLTDVPGDPEPLDLDELVGLSGLADCPV